MIEATLDQGRLPDDFDEVDGQDTGRLRVVRRGGLDEIARLQLLPKHQSRGFGRTVVGTVVAQSRASGLPVELGAEKDNPRARAFWERCGFSYVGEHETEHRRLAT